MGVSSENNSVISSLDEARDKAAIESPQIDRQPTPRPRGPQAGERSRLDRDFEAFRPSLLTFLRSRVASIEIAEDLLQQTFLRVVQRVDWAAVDNPKAYLMVTARRVLSDHYRRRDVKLEKSVESFHEEQHGDERWAPTRWVRSQEKLMLLTKALEGLSHNVRNAFVLSRVHGYTYVEIGKKLAISPRTVEKHVAKGLATCYRALTEDDEPIR